MQLDQPKTLILLSNSIWVTGFDRKSSFSFPGCRFGQNVIIFGVQMSSSHHVDNNKKEILILSKGPAQGLEHTLTAKKCIQLILL